MGALQIKYLIGVISVAIFVRTVVAESNTTTWDVIHGVRNIATMQDALQSPNYSSYSLSSIATFILAQFFHASTADTLPTLPTWKLSFRNNFAKINICERKDVAACMNYGALTRPLQTVVL
jgi:hypothetical protein